MLSVLLTCSNNDLTLEYLRDSQELPCNGISFQWPHVFSIRNMSLSDFPCFRIVSETPVFCSRQSVSRCVGKPPLPSPCLCLVSMKFFSKVPLLGIMCSAVNFLFPL